MRQKAGVERHNPQPQLHRQPGTRADGFQIFCPSRVWRNAAGRADCFQRGIIFAEAAEHPGNTFNFILPEQRFRFAPDSRRLAQRIKRQLDAPEAGG